MHNVKHGFTLIGLTHELPTTAKMVGKVFPWMADADPWADLDATTTTTTATTRTTSTVTSGACPRASVRVDSVQKRRALLHGGWVEGLCANMPACVPPVTSSPHPRPAPSPGTTKRQYLPRKKAAAQQCPLPHANASPSNNRCGAGNTHMPLPEEPDEHTRKLIIEHNKQDMAVYNAAVQMFALQRKILEL